MKYRGGLNMCQIFAGQDPADYEPETRRLRLNGQSTSIRLERSFWQIVDEIAAAEGLTTPAFVSKLHSEVLELHGEARNFTSLLRCACIVRVRHTMAPIATIAAE
ncbi:ribbon-helix-helix domain-containing protein [uncultured Roseibium sp.]|uniref:ribbon-helix-helix domain-containing protein n=1 Tax=uncultured Roseibium sp. TaxID=1936171 RepID=UPI003216A15D